MSARSIPAPGTAELPAANAAALLRRNATDPSIAHRPALRFGDQVFTHEQFLAYAKSCCAAGGARFIPLRDVNWNNEDALFLDSQHLNQDGREIFSIATADALYEEPPLVERASVYSVAVAPCVPVS